MKKTEEDKVEKTVQQELEEAVERFKAEVADIARRHALKIAKQALGLMDE